MKQQNLFHRVRQEPSNPQRLMSSVLSNAADRKDGVRVKPRARRDFHPKVSAGCGPAASGKGVRKEGSSFLPFTGAARGRGEETAG